MKGLVDSKGLCAAVHECQANDVVNDLLSLWEAVALRFAEDEVTVKRISKILRTYAPHIDLEFTHHLWLFVVTNNGRIGKVVSDEIAKIVKLGDKLVFRVAAVLEVIRTLRASVDIDLELPLAPILSDSDVPNHEPLFLLVLVDVLLCRLCHRLRHLLRGDLRDIVKASLNAVERIDLYLVEVSALEHQSFPSQSLLLSKLLRYLLVVDFLRAFTVEVGRRLDLYDRRPGLKEHVELGDSASESAEKLLECDYFVLSLVRLVF